MISEVLCPVFWIHLLTFGVNCVGCYLVSVPLSALGNAYWLLNRNNIEAFTRRLLNEVISSRTRPPVDIRRNSKIIIYRSILTKHSQFCLSRIVWMGAILWNNTPGLELPVRWITFEEPEGHDCGSKTVWWILTWKWLSKQ